MAHAQQAAAERHEDLPEIPVFDVGPDFAIETARLAGRDRAYAMLDAATAGVPMLGLRLADAISRRWLSAQQSPYLPELDQLASLSTRPGAYFLNVHYEWGCTTAAKPGMDGASARLLRALDWNVNGLGRHIVAARTASAFGSLGLSDLARLYRRPAGDGARAVRGRDQSTDHKEACNRSTNGCMAM